MLGNGHVRFGGRGWEDRRPRGRTASRLRPYTARHHHRHRHRHPRPAAAPRRRGGRLRQLGSSPPPTRSTVTCTRRSRRDPGRRWTSPRSSTTSTRSSPPTTTRSPAPSRTATSPSGRAGVSARAPWVTHFGLTRTPFSKSIAAADLLGRDAPAEAVARISFCIAEGALGVVVGDVGAGKTVAVRAAVAGLDRTRHQVIYIPNYAFGARGLYVAIVTALGGVPRYRKPELIAQAADFLAAEEAARHRRVVIVIDEAHLLAPDQLEELRLLTNADFDSRSPFAGILVGQPTLSRRLRMGAFAALDQRIAVRFSLDPMDPRRVRHLPASPSRPGRPHRPPLRRRRPRSAPPRRQRPAPCAQQRRHRGPRRRRRGRQGAGRRRQRQAGGRRVHPRLTALISVPALSSSAPSATAGWGSPHLHPRRLPQISALDGGVVMVTTQRCQMVTSELCHSMFTQLRREHQVVPRPSQGTFKGSPSARSAPKLGVSTPPFRGLGTGVGRSPAAVEHARRAPVRPSAHT